MAEVNDKGYLICPKCGGRTKAKVQPGVTVLLHFPLYCPFCRTETVINYPAAKRDRKNT